MKVALLLLPLAGCMTLDSFVYSPVHCSTVGPATCDDEPDPWSKVCKTCEEAYDWTRDYPWPKSTLGEDESIRPIPADAIVHHILQTTDGQAQLDVYFIPSHGEQADLARTTILYDHGNYAGIEHYQPRVRMFYEAGYNVLVWDYRGYGKSEPNRTATPDQFMADADLLRDEVDNYAPDADRIVTYGYSLGGLAAVEQQLYKPSCALMLEASFTSMDLIAQSNSETSIPGGFLSSGRFDVVSAISKYDGPLLMMRGSQDTEFSAADEQKVYDACPSTDKVFWTVDGAQHGVGRGVPEAGLDAWKAQMHDFLASHAPECLAP